MSFEFLSGCEKNFANHIFILSKPSGILFLGNWYIVYLRLNRLVNLPGSYDEQLIKSFFIRFDMDAT